MFINEKNQFIVTTLDINAPKEQFEVVIVKKEGYNILKDRLSHRNSLIKKLREALKNRIAPLSKGHCVYESAMRYKKFDHSPKCKYEVILK